MFLLHVSITSLMVKKDESIDKLIDSIQHTNNHDYAIFTEHSYTLRFTIVILFILMM